MERWKVRRRREEHKTLLVFPSLKPLYYYWLLIFYFNIVHILWTNKESRFTFRHVHIIQLLVFCCDAVQSSSVRSNMPDHAILSIALQYPYRNGTAAHACRACVRIIVLFYTVNFTTYSSKVDYTILTLVPRQDTAL